MRMLHVHRIDLNEANSLEALQEERAAYAADFSEKPDPQHLRAAALFQARWRFFVGCSAKQRQIDLKLIDEANLHWRFAAAVVTATESDLRYDCQAVPCIYLYKKLNREDNDVIFRLRQEAGIEAAEQLKRQYRFLGCDGDREEVAA